jgi:hypothetical protein
VFLELSGVNATRASNDAVFGLVLDVAAGHLELGEIAVRLKRIVSRRRG